MITDQQKASLMKRYYSRTWLYRAMTLFAYIGYSREAKNLKWFTRSTKMHIRKLRVNKTYIATGDER